MHLHLERLATPIGTMLLVTDGADQLRAADWDDCVPRMQRLLRLHYGEHATEPLPRPSPSAAHHALAAYFDGELGAIDGLAVATGGTPFQRAVWAALRCIPAGQSRSYGQLAVQLDRAAAVRAVGAANGANPVGIVVPCHRVIGAGGALTGYAGGLPRKAWLLRHEAGHG